MFIYDHIDPYNDSGNSPGSKTVIPGSNLPGKVNQNKYGVRQLIFDSVAARMPLEVDVRSAKN